MLESALYTFLRVDREGFWRKKTEDFSRNHGELSPLIIQSCSSLLFE